VADQRLDRAALLGLLPLAAIRLAARREQDLPPGRCLRCKDRPAHFAYDVYNRDDRRRGPPTAEDLQPCVCGFEPMYCEIRYSNSETGEPQSQAEMAEMAAALDEGRYEAWWWSVNPSLARRQGRT
jgi:hypothetical protein